MIATSANPTVYVLLFSFSIVLTYLTVRRGWLHLPAATITGVIYTSVSFFLYSLARGNNLIQALSVGIGLGTVFTLAAVVIAAGFRANALESGRESLEKVPSSAMAGEETTL